MTPKNTMKGDSPEKAKAETPNRAVTDVTEHEETFRLTFDQSPVGAAILDATNGLFTRTNTAFCRFTGYTSEELTRFTFKDLTYPDDLPSSMEQTRKVLAREINGFEMEKRYLRKDGSLAWGRLSVRAITDRSGNIRYTLAMIQDITAAKDAELHLRESEEAVKSLLNATSDLAVLIDTKGKIIAANRVFAHRLGKQPEELIGQTVFQFFPEEAAAFRQLQLQKVLVTGEPLLFEDTSSDGRSLDVCGYPLLDSERKVTRIAVYARDITETKEVIRALAESEAKFRQIFDSIHDGIAVWDVTTFELIDANKRFCEMYGYSLEELKSLPLGSLSAGESPSERERRLSAHYTLANEGLSRLFQAEAMRKDGSTFWVEVNVKRIFMGGRESLLAVARDITERRAAEEALRESESRFRYLFDSVRDGIAVRDAQTLELLDVNRRFCELWGYGFEELKVLPLGSLGAGESVEERRARLMTYYEQVSKGTPALYEWAARRKDGSTFWVELNGTKITMGNRDCLLLVIRDITERRKAQEALRGSEEAALRLAQETAVIAELGRIMNSSLDLEEVYERFAEEVRKLIPFDRILINLINKQDGTLTTAYTAGMVVEGRIKGVVLPIEGSITEQMLHTGAPVIIESESVGEVLDRYPSLIYAFEAGLHSRLSVPLLTRGEVIGSLALWSKQPHAYREREARLAENVASQIAGTVSNAELFRERSRAEEALRVSEEGYRSLVETSPDAIFLHDGGKFLYVNPAAVRLYGALSAKEMYGLNAFDIIHPDDRESIQNRTHFIMTTGLPVPLKEIRIVRRDGSTVHVEATAAISYYQGKKVIQVIQRDITERKRAEEKIKASLAEKEVLLKEIHHRVKNNLQIISSLLYLQSTRTDHTEAVSALQESRTRIKSMALIHERLYASPDLASVDMGKYTKNLVSDLQQSYLPEDGHIRLRLNLEAISLGINEAIPCGLIINELVSNALKHAFQKGQPGEIKVELKRTETKQVRLIVSDNGIGFPQEIDFRKSPSLGLTLINSLVDQLNGTIRLDRGNGTTFTITFGS
ncbi:MAG TPA: PAS domain S-box protein [Syntrophorhabdales bacterium]|nr:PAS domain S-box protein [Syntrophorhabdales bacterium]